MSIINKEFIKKYITNNGDEGEVPFRWSHGSTDYHMGDGILIYSLIYYLRLKTCVCLGSGGGFIPRIITQARLDLVNDGTLDSDDGKTIVVDVMDGEWGDVDWESENSFFRKHFNPIVIKDTTENAYFNYFIKNKIKIDYLHIDANHLYEYVKKDFEMYSSILSGNGFITIHDTDFNYADNIWGKGNYEKKHYNFTDGPSEIVKEITESGKFELLNLANSYNVKKDKNSTGITILKRKKNK
jgi:hypothetical protein